MGKFIRTVNNALDDAFGVRIQKSGKTDRVWNIEAQAVSGISECKNLPTIVSFYGGSDYYYRSAEALKKDCEALGIPHDIVEIDTTGLKWPEICRLKIEFYKTMHDKHGSIMWIDVDDRIVKVPAVLDGLKFDLAGFGGRRRYIRDYDPYKVTRFWIPSILYFGPTERAARFIQAMADMEKATPADVTDDWVLHETWMTFDEQMNVGLFSPEIMAKDMNSVNSQSVFVHGDSGNVREFKGTVVQHSRKLDDSSLRGLALGTEATSAMKSGDKTGARTLAKYAHKLLPNDPEATLRYSNYLQLTGSRGEARKVLGNFLTDNPDGATVRESLVKLLIKIKDFDQASENLDYLVSSPDPQTKARAQSSRYEFELDKRAYDLNIPDSQRVKMWWMKTPYPGNFGDVLSPWIVDRVTGIPPKFGARNNSLLAIGSIIKFGTEKSSIWGSGTPHLDDKLNPNANYLAVRGPLTRDLVLRNGGNCPEIFGDPGLLLPKYLPVNPEKNPKYKIGLIQHVGHSKTRNIHPEIKQISLLGAAPEVISRVVDEITDCEMVLSTSLHGIIIANAYGIPARWCVFGDDMTAISGDGTKYKDYFLSVDMPIQEPLDLAEVVQINESLERHIHRNVDLQFDGDKLEAALLNR